MLRLFIIGLIFLFTTQAWADETVLLNRATIVDYAPRIGLALGGGSARGLTHLGVLSVFEEEGIPIAVVSGTSMGAIVGSFYALGFSISEMRDDFKRLNMGQIFTLTQFPQRTYIGKTPLYTFFEEEPVGVFQSYAVEEFLRQKLLLRDYQYQFDFDRYPTKLRIVSTDFLSGDEVVFSQGPVYQAVCASMSLPFVFKPYEWQGRYFVDGALVENVPVSPLLGVSLDYRIAVDVSQPETGPERIYRTDSYIAQLSAILVQRISQQTLDKADLLVHIPPTTMTKDDYGKLDEFIAVGRKTMQADFAPIRALVAAYDARAPQLTVRQLRNETSQQLTVPLQTPIAKTALLRSLYKQMQPFAAQVHLTKNLDGSFDLLVVPATFQTQLVVPRVNDIKVIGLKSISESVVKGMIKLNVPDPYNRKRIEQMVRYLYGTGLFSSVHTSLEKDQSGGVILIVAVKEKQKGLFYIDGAYYSAEGLPEVELGFLDSYRLGRNRFQLSLRSGAYAGGMATFEMYDLLGTNIGFGLAHDQTNRDIRLYTDYKPTERVHWLQAATDIYINYTSYDYLYATVGLRAYKYALYSQSTQKDYQVPRLHVEYDNLDQIYVPQQGFRLNGFWETGVLNRHSVQTWAAMGLPNQHSLWLQYAKGHAPRTEYYLWDSPERSLLPFGFVPAEGLAATYDYTRVSLVRSVFMGLAVELAADAYLGEFRTTGGGIFVHYPLDIGCVSAGYGTNDHTAGVFLLNFSKTL